MEEKKKYAQGRHPNSLKAARENMAHYEDFTPEQQAKFHSLGGKARGAKEREKVIIQKVVEQAVNSIYTDKDTGEEGNPIVIAVGKIVARLMKKGDIKDLEAIAKYLGQEPAQKVEQLVITPEVDFDKLGDLRKELKGE